MFDIGRLTGRKRLSLRDGATVSDESDPKLGAHDHEPDQDAIPPMPDDDKALAEFQSRYQALAENTRDLLSELDEDGNFLYLSPMHQEALGWEVGSYLGKSAFEVIHPDDHGLARGELQRAMSQGNGCATIRVRRADGSWRWFECAGRTRQTAEGERRLVLISRNVHDSIMAEQRLQRQQRSLKQMLDVRDRDHRVLAHEIHDGLTQDMTGALLYVESAEAITDDPARRAQHLRTAKQLLRGAINEARRLINGLLPPVLDAHGVEAAIRHMIDEMSETSGLTIQFRAVISFRRAPAAIENAIYRIVQESLHNVRRHSGATEASVEVAQLGDRVKIVVADPGNGFDPGAVPPSRHGIHGICERARLLGGTSEIQSAVGQGTRVFVELPLVEVDSDETPPPESSI